MVDNWLLSFDMEEQTKIDKKVGQHLIRMTDACVGCGICTKVCPSDSIRLEKGRAVHIPGRCQTCLACVHACPYKAIGLTVPEKNPQARYRNDHISLGDIIAANGKSSER